MANTVGPASFTTSFLGNSTMASLTALDTPLVQKSSFLLLVLWLSAVVVYRLWLHPLSAVPGPFPARLSSIWITRKYMGKSWHEDVVDLHKRYGRVVRITPNEVSVVDEQAMKSLYSHRQNTAKSSWYNAWAVPGGSAALFAERDKKLHGFLRKRVSHAFSVSSLLTMEEYIQSCLDTFVAKMDKFAKAQSDVNMSDWTNALAFDVIGELGYGEAFGHMETESDVLDLRSTILRGFKGLSMVGYLPGQSRLLDNPITRLFSASPTDQFGLYTMKILQDRKSEKDTRRTDLLHHWMNMKRADGTPARDEEVFTEMFSIIGGGGDTTSILMRACFYYLGKHPAVYATLQKELDDSLSGYRLSDHISYKETQKLPFLQAFVKESARLWPSIVWQLPRESPADGLTILNRYFIPAGYSISISPMAQNRDVAIYGEDAEVFKPERWLESDEVSRKLDGLSMTFGGNGPRACMGKNLALMEVQLLIARFMKHFNFEFVNKQAPWNVNATWFASQNDLWIKVRSRSGSK
ncbi:hypothetical protein SCUP515_06732 [Seiridium cupressi]